MTTIVIGLAAVVALILVVVLLALRYLRADDSDDFEDMPEGRSHAHGSADDRGRRVAARQPARSSRPPRVARDAEPRRPADRVRRAAPDVDRPGRYDARDHVDERGGQRAAASYDDRRGSEGAVKRRQESLPAVRPRPARGKRAEEDGDWPSTKWDKLSDVDYWAEVASDKPLTTTAQPAAQARPARPGQARDAEARQGSRTGAPERNPGPRLPVRGTQQPAAAGPVAAGARGAEFMSAPHATGRAHPGRPPRPAAAGGRESGLSPLASRDSMPPGPPRPAAIDDDDPLTSPSFPRIPADDSRSYHGGHADSLPSGSRGTAPYAAVTQQFAAYGSPSGQLDGYGAAGRQPAVPTSGFGQPGRQAADYASPPPYRPAPSPGPGSYGGRDEQLGRPASSGGYPAPDGHLPPPSSALPAPAPSQAAPSGNPYGSYVTPPAGSYLPSSPAGPADSGRPANPGYGGYSAGSGGPRESSYSQPAIPGETAAAHSGAVSGWYPDLPAPVPPPSAYLDVSRPLPSPGIPASGYLNGNGHAERTGHPGGQHEPAGYLPTGYSAVPHDPAGYEGPDPYGRDPYGRDPYGGYPGYGPADR